MAKRKQDQVDAFGEGISSPVDVALDTIRKFRAGNASLEAVSAALQPLSGEMLQVVAFCLRAPLAQLRQLRDAGRDPSIT